MAEPENIAVCIRVRPLSERETRAGDAAALSCVPQLNVVSLLDPSTGAPLGGKSNVFQYDGVFDASSDSRAIYERVARRIVHSTLSGINGSIFAYGQTSSGKTHTMQGDGGMPFEPEHETLQPGLLQLAVEDIFSYIETCRDRDFLLRVSFLEIYNEVVKDLLSETGATLKLREDPRKGVYVESKEQIITNYEDIVTLLQTGNQNRTTGQTAMNDKSSRSHSVFRIVIESKHKSGSRRHSEEDVNGAVLVASLNLVDLAGSESLRHTGAEGIRQREAGNINKSLLTLARVINSLASSGGGGQNAPFRDSKLTRLLQNSLGGNTRTLIVCCVTPSDRYIEETKSTLQFAARAKDVKTSATVNEVMDDQTQLRRLKREVRELKKLVNSEAIDALKAENEALLSEKNHNKTEVTRLMGLILSSSSVTKAAVGRKRKQRMRETWGPGDFPASIKALAYPRKRHSPAKENADPQILFRVHENSDEGVEKEAENPAFKSASNKLMPIHADLSIKDSTITVLDLFSEVFRSFHDGNGEEPIEALETIANEKSASLGDIERVRTFDVLAEIRTLMVANVQSKAVIDEKLELENELKELHANLGDENTKDTPASCDCSENASKASSLVEEIMAELVSTQEQLASEKKLCQDLAAEKVNTQYMAAEELDCLRAQLQAMQLDSAKAREEFDAEKCRFEAALETFQSGLPLTDDDEAIILRNRKHELESLLEEMKASQTVLQMAVAERDGEIASLKSTASETNQGELESRVKCLEDEKAVPSQRISEIEAEERNTASTTEVLSSSGEKEAQEGTSATIQAENGIAEKLAGELQEIMQELAQLQSDHDKTAMEKKELYMQTERIIGELEESRRHGYEMSETLMEKDHIAKVLQAQLDAKVMTIAQMQSKHSGEIEALQLNIQDLMTEKEKFLVEISDVTSAQRTATDDEETASFEPKTNDNAQNDADELHNPDAETQTMPLEVDQLTEKLSMVEAELAETKERLQVIQSSSEDPSEQSELQTAYEKLKSDYDILQESKVSSDAQLEQQQSAEVSCSDQQSTNESEHLLSEDYKRVTDDLDRVSREHNDCLEELRALESQLMEMSEEKMKLAVSADEQDVKLREAEHAVLASSERLATLQEQLEEAHAAKAALEASKAELEENVEQIQTALAALQADHAAIVEQIQNYDVSSQPSNTTDVGELEQLQQRFEIEVKQREKFQLDVQSYEETLSLLRKEAKGSSDTIADLLEKMKLLETDLASASRTQEQKDKELSSLRNALTRSEEEKEEMRFQSKQRLVAAEGKEMELEEKISALEHRLRTTLTGMAIVNVSAESATQTEFSESREEETKLQAKIAMLESQLDSARQELRQQDEGWNKKQALAEREFARLMTERKQLCDQLSALQISAGASQQGIEEQAEELLKAKQSYAEILDQKEAVQRELDGANATWEENQQELTHQMESVREQYQEAQEELESYQKNADDEIYRLRSVIEQTEAEIENLKASAKTREEELETQISEQVAWQNQVKDRQEELQAKCNELDDEHQSLKEDYAALATQRKELEEQLRGEIQELSQKYAAEQEQQADSHEELQQMKAHFETSENEMNQYRSELESLTESLKSSQMEAHQYHNQLVEAQLAKESMDKLVATQKARIDKLDKVKMTTGTLDLFRRLKNDRLNLQNKVKELQKELTQAEQTLQQSQEIHHEKEQRQIDCKDDELKLSKNLVEELRAALRDESHQLAEVKAEMRAALKDEREKAEHEIQEMQVVLREKMDLVEQLEAQVRSVSDEMANLREQKSEKVSYLEKETLDLHVENRELKKRLDSSWALHEREELLGDTGTYDASAAEAAKILGKESTPHESNGSPTPDVDTLTKSAPPTQEAVTTKAGGFCLSTTELDAIAAGSQDEPNEGVRPECTQQ